MNSLPPVQRLTNGDAKTAHQHRGRTLILCFDGTSNEYDNTNTNVVRLFSCLEKSHPKQLVYYQTGIGTYSTTKFMTSFGTWASKIVDEAVAWNLEEHVCNGYRFLQSKWRHGDKICIFGFSRGAYTARALAGMLHAVGLLPESMPDQVQFAYKLYKGLESGDPKTNPSQNYKRDFSRDVTIDFLGVWDTVASVGILVSRVLPFSQSNDTIKVFRHAMALDERRVKFLPSPWRLSLDRPKSDHDDALGRFIRGISHYSATLGDLMSWFHAVLHFVFTPLSTLVNLIHPGSAKKIDKEKPAPSGAVPPDVLEVWFTGAHCDVGGGNEKDEDVGHGTYSPSLANVPLRWMISELYNADKKYNFNIRWRHERLPRYGIFLPPTTYTNETGLDPDYLPLVLDDSLAKGEKTPLPAPCGSLSPSERPKVSDTETAPLLPPDEPPSKANLRHCENGIIIDEDFHIGDLKRDIQSAVWRWNSPAAIMKMMMWWLFEFFPFMIYSQNKVTREWESSLRCNFFRAREAPKDAVPSPKKLAVSTKEWGEFLERRSTALFHESVRERMELKERYRPAAWGKDTKEWKEWPKAVHHS